MGTSLQGSVRFFSENEVLRNLSGLYFSRVEKHARFENRTFEKIFTDKESYQWFSCLERTKFERKIGFQGLPPIFFQKWILQSILHKLSRGFLWEIMGTRWVTDWKNPIFYLMSNIFESAITWKHVENWSEKRIF